MSDLFSINARACPVPLFSTPLEREEHQLEIKVQTRYIKQTKDHGSQTSKPEQIAFKRENQPT
jgi:hypothetical protein